MVPHIKSTPADKKLLYFNELQISLDFNNGNTIWGESLT
jgi:hypothetical protein